MSHLTATLFNKPSPFDVPRPVHPLSPPDTEQDFVGPAVVMPPAMPPVGPSTESEPGLSSQSPLTHDSPGARLRRVAYVNSGLRDLRDARENQSQNRDRSVQRGLRWLLAVIPPAGLSQQEHAHLGHTLSSGPHHRLSQGILMPLFPTMYAQLTAIAREFSFPSTAGLCLYLHITEAGFTMTPRISDETWQFLWAHLFDPRSQPPASHGLPIGGRVEFDIDPRKARWYEPWLHANRREANDLPVSVAPSMSHWRQDSRGSFAPADERRTTYGGDERSPPGDQPDDVSITQSTTVRRNVPRKLSLLDRFDTASVRSGKTPAAAGEEADQSDPNKSNQLTPIAQEDEPVTAKHDLENRVNSWRVSAQPVKTPMAARGQPSLDPANMPNSLSLNDPAITLAEQEETQSELNLDDFTWSISSAGPASEPPSPAFSWGYVRSPHMDRRAQGSVCLTPSVCTSFGPDAYYDEGALSPLSNVLRLPSPDIGVRMLSDCPPTPTTATSWGPGSWPPSPAYSSRALSIDLGHRGVYSRPATPTTATSWGPSSWPASPALSAFSEVSSVDLAARAAGSPVDEQFSTRTRAMVWPYYDAWQGEVWEHTWPYTAIKEASKPRMWDQVWPYREAASDAGVWGQVWPYKAALAKEQARTGRATASAFDAGSTGVYLRPRYPVFDLYPAVYPNLEVYPAVSEIERSVDVGGVPIKLGKDYPVFDLYPAAYPYNVSEIYAATVVDDDRYYKSLPVSLPALYPAFDLYRSGYPVLEIYPAAMGEISQRPQSSQKVARRRGHPSRQYPDFDIYPVGEKLDDTYYFKAGTVLLGEPTAYPTMIIYPAVHTHGGKHSGLYPDLNIYPVGRKLDDRFYYKSLSVLLGAPSAYPVLTIYPAIHSLDGCLYPDFDIYPVGQKLDDTHYYKSLSVHLGAPSAYPVLSIYPAISSLGQAIRAPRGRAFKLAPQYPDFNIYPTGEKLDDKYYFKALSVLLGEPTLYPVMSIYPATLPYMDRRAPATRTAAVGHAGRRPSKSPVNTRRRMSIICSPTPATPQRLPRAGHVLPMSPLATAPSSRALVLEGVEQKGGSRREYPNLCIYPAAYPFFDLYPMAAAQLLEERSWIGFDVFYPSFNIYPAVYPHMDIYAPVPSLGSERESLTLLPSFYPIISLYSAEFPYFEIYPGEVCDGSLHILEKPLQPAYPIFSIYRPVYPLFEIYPGEVCDATLLAQDVALQAAYPTFSIFATLYPFFEIYPGQVSTGEITICRPLPTKLPAEYPAFDFYSVEYPHLEIYPAPSHATSTSPRQRRRTHRQLHEDVASRFPALFRHRRRTHAELYEDVVARFPALFHRRRRTHAELYEAVMRGQTVREEAAKPSPPQQSLARSRSRSGTVSARVSALSGRSIPAAKPAPSSGAQMRLPMIPGSPAEPEFEMLTPPPTTNAPYMPSDDVARRVATASRAANTLLAPTRELHRAQSARTHQDSASSPVLTTLDRSKSLSDASRSPTKAPAPKRRESLVMERARAFGQPVGSAADGRGHDAPPLRLSMNHLSQFPMPPRPSMPAGTAPVVSKLDRSKFPFA